MLMASRICLGALQAANRLGHHLRQTIERQRASELAMQQRMEELTRQLFDEVKKSESLSIELALFRDWQSRHSTHHSVLTSSSA
jgi:hypothetical protein